MSGNAKKSRVGGVLAAFTALALASCTAISGLSGLTFDGAGGGSCTRDAQCDSGNACRIGSCDADGTCHVEDAPDGTTPTPENPCKLTGCASGQPVTKSADEGAQCDVIDKHGVCVHGNCAVPCQADGDCTTSDACTSGTCNKAAGKCAFDRLDGVPVPGATQVVGDCKEKDCKVGVTTVVPDDHDVAASSVCETASCDNGTPKSNDAPARSPCSTQGGSLCDGKGHCVACVGPKDCATPPNPCQASTCQGGQCGTINVVAGPSQSLAGLQTSGDCLQVECDGNGGTMNAVDISDPRDDGNPCTTDVCGSGGTTVHTPLSDGTPCGNSTCVNGHCGCSTKGDCPANPNEQCTNHICVCTPSTCAGLGATCGLKPDGCGNMINCGNASRDGTETDVDCGGPSCPACPQGGFCNAGNDCSAGQCVDGVCCESDCSGGCTACSNALTGQADGLCRAIPAGMDPKNSCTSQSLSTCGRDGNCDGMGACAYYMTGTVCDTHCQGSQATTSTCVGPNMCNVTSTVGCSPYRCGQTACKTSCTFNSDCANGHTCNAATMQCI